LLEDTHFENRDRRLQRLIQSERDHERRRSAPCCAMHRQSKVTLLRRVTVALARSAIFYSTTPLGSCVGSSSILENGSPAARFFCLPRSWGTSIRRKKNFQSD